MSDNPMTLPASVRPVPSTKTTIEISTGNKTEEDFNWSLMPPAPDVCQVCAADHKADMPHNAQSMYYCYAFRGAQGRWPTWADALAHCTDEMTGLWREQLELRNAWSEPEAGTDPVAHLGEPQ